MPDIEFFNITKKFGELTANDDISFKILSDTVHCIVGENGAGKSTLMKILFGVYHPDKGYFCIGNDKKVFSSTYDAISNGIGMLFQHYMLIDDFTVLENVILGREPEKKFSLDYRKSENILKELIDKYNLNLSLDKKISDLSISEQQKVEILKILYRNSDIIIFDEPTAVLSPLEVREFFNIVLKFKEDNKTIILITHKLKEVKEIADRVSVLRRGKLVYECTKEELDIEKLSINIIGEIVEKDIVTRKEDVSEKKTLINFKNVGYISGNRKILDNLNLELKTHEIFGICGVEGNGQNEIVQLMMGMIKPSEGNMYKIIGEISLVPDDRIKKGMIENFNIGENILLKSPLHYISKKNIRNISKNIISKYDVRVPDFNVPMSALSGGNQQKVIVAREIELDNKAIIFYHPTRGVDIKATGFINSKIIEMRNSGRAILLISSDIDELLGLSDRLGVLYRGKISKVFEKNEINFKDDKSRNELLEKLGKLMVGINQE